MTSVSSSSSSLAAGDITVSDILNQISIDLEHFRNLHKGHTASIPKVANTGFVYKHFKPKNNHSLYAQIIADSDGAEEVGRNWVAAWQNNPDEELISMLQLFVDVAGFQDYSVKENYEMGTDNEMLSAMVEEAPSDLFKHGYLLQKKTKWARYTVQNLSVFVKAVVLASESKRVLFQNIFFEPLNFVKVLCKSRIRALKHTGVFFAVLFCLEIGEIAQNICFVLAKLSVIFHCNAQFQEQLSAKLECCKSKQQFCACYVDCLICDILSECTTNDPDLKELHEFCAKELAVLYYRVHVPRRQKVLSVLTEFVKYSYSLETRMAALKSFEDIFIDTRLAMAKSNAEPIFAVLYKSTLEASEVAAQALRTFTAAMKRRPEFFTSDLLAKLFLFVYNKSYIVGKEAGGLFMAHVKSRTAGSLKEIYTEMAQFQSLSSHEGLAMVFIESILEVAPELTSPEVAINLLLEGSLEFNQEVALLEIVAYSFVNIITGRSVRPRHDSVPSAINEATNENIFSQVLPKLSMLFQRCANEEKLLKSLLLIMKNLPSEGGTMIKYQSHLTRTLGMYTKLFLTTTSLNIMGAINDALDATSVDLSPVRTQATAAVKGIMEKCLDDYRELLSQPDWDENVQSVIVRVLQRLTAIISCPTWDDLFPTTSFTPVRTLQECDPLTVVYDVKCEYGFLLHKLRMFVKNSDSKYVEGLRRRYLRFVEGCCDVFNASYSRENKLVVLECFVDMCLFQKKNANVSNVLPQLSKKQLSAICLCVKEQLAHKCNASVEILHKLILNIHLVPCRLTLYVWALYNKFYNLYGGCYDDCLKKFFKVSAVGTTALMHMVIVAEYEGLISHGIAASDNSKDLEKLSLQFSRVTPTSQRVRIIFALIKVAAEKVENLDILQYAIYFSTRLTKKDLDELLLNVTRTFKGPRMVHKKVRALLKCLEMQPVEELVAEPSDTPLLVKVVNNPPHDEEEN